MKSQAEGLKKNVQAELHHDGLKKKSTGRRPETENAVDCTRQLGIRLLLY